MGFSLETAREVAEGKAVKNHQTHYLLGEGFEAQVDGDRAGVDWDSG